MPWLVIALYGTLATRTTKAARGGLFMFDFLSDFVPS